MTVLLSLFDKELESILDLIGKVGQRESGRRLFLGGGLAACFLGAPALAQDKLDAGKLSFRDFSTNDNGASFSRGDPMIAGGPNQVSSRIAAIESDKGLARIQFGSIRVELAVPLGWQAHEDWERGVAYSSDKRYRVLVWRVDFAYEGVKDAEHYAATKAGSIQARRPTVQAQARKLGDGTFLIVYDNVKTPGDAEPRVVFDLVTGVPTSEAARGLQLMALLKENVKINW